MTPFQVIELKKIVSGGQTGVDRAALDIALELNISPGGWCPKGRKAEDGVIDAKYPLRETPDEKYLQRTQFNVRDSEATLIITPTPLSGGTALTKRFATDLDRPCLVIDPDDPDAREAIFSWLKQNNITILNVAGPRESSQPGLHEKTLALLRKVIMEDRDGTQTGPR